MSIVDWAIGLVIALAWKDVITNNITRLTLTGILVIGIVIVNKWAKQKRRTNI